MSATKFSLPDAAEAINHISTFISNEQISGVQGLSDFLQGLSSKGADDSGRPDVLVICVSSVLAVAEAALNTLASDSERITSGNDGNLIVVFCGGIGHSTPYVYEAVEKHEQYRAAYDQVKGLPEASVLKIIADRFYSLKVSCSVRQAREGGILPIILEDQSTNCGSNAVETRKVLEANGVTHPRSIIIAQDPTMCRRMVASFDQVYADLGEDESSPIALSWPTFVPQVMEKSSTTDSMAGNIIQSLEYRQQGVPGPVEGLWDMRRFVNLVMGEIPRLRDDESGYGPKGKGFIAHVDMPQEVENAWLTLSEMLGDEDRVR